MYILTYKCYSLNIQKGSVVMAVDFKLIGKRLQDKRNDIKQTQEEWAEYLHVSVGYVSNMERGTTKISLTTLVDISDFLGCDVSDLVSKVSTNGNTYLSEELSQIINSLSNHEKNILLSLLQTYKKQN